MPIILAIFDTHFDIIAAYNITVDRIKNCEKLKINIMDKFEEIDYV